MDHKVEADMSGVTWKSPLKHTRATLSYPGSVREAPARADMDRLDWY